MSEEEKEPFRILFVCTGNTCRSPLAEALARRALSERGWSHVEVSSAGVSTLQGTPASDGALRAALEEGLDLSEHRSALLTAERVEEADLVLGMTPSHVLSVDALGGEGKSALLGAFAAGEEGGEGPDVPDPFGGDAKRYRETVETLKRMVERTLSRLEPVVAP